MRQLHQFQGISTRSSSLLAVLAAALFCLGACSNGGAPSDTGAEDVAGDVASDTETDTATDSVDDTSNQPVTVRVATFNASLHRSEQGELAEDLAGGDDSQASEVAEVIQRTRPDVLLVNEFDWDGDGESARLFQEEYLSQSQDGAEPIDYPHRYVPETNTGVHSGVDLDNSGEAVSTPGSQAYGNDAFGFGEFPGQYGMVVYSRYPIVEGDIRTFREFLWKDMPDNLLPDDWYSSEAIDVLRLSSKTHIDVPIRVDDRTIHVLGSHPTPPSFDGPEDRNGRRNHDEIRFWTDYVAGGTSADYIRDDDGTSGGLAGDAHFVIVGDLNSDPNDGDSRHEGINDLIASARLADPEPTSEGAVQAASTDGQANETHETDPALDTADFSDGSVGNLRVDYALPSESMIVEDASVFWPTPDDELAHLSDVSDHHLVWVDVTLDGSR